MSNLNIHTDCIAQHIVIYWSLRLPVCLCQYSNAYFGKFLSLFKTHTPDLWPHMVKLLSWLHKHIAGALEWIITSFYHMPVSHMFLHKFHETFLSVTFHFMKRPALSGSAFYQIWLGCFRNSHPKSYLVKCTSSSYKKMSFFHRIKCDGLTSFMEFMSKS